jgi:hypothetical protein
MPPSAQPTGFALTSGSAHNLDGADLLLSDVNADTA